MPNEFVARNGIIALNNSTITGSFIVTGGITGSISGSHVGNTTGTASWALNFVTSSVTSASYAATASYFITSSVTSASYAGTASLLLGSVTSASYAGTASLLLGSVTSASFGATASYLNTISQPTVLITSNVGIGTSFPTSKLQVSGSANVLNVRGSGSSATQSLFTVDGAAGRLFSVNDSLSGSLFSVNTIAGLPVIEAFSDNTVRIGQYGQKALFVSQSRVGIGTETPTALLHITSSTGTIFELDGSGSSNAFSVSSSGRVGIGTDTPAGRLDVVYGGLLNDPTILLGANDNGTTIRTNNTAKIARIGVAHYSSSATASTILIADSTDTANRVFIGGGSAYMNAATEVLFYTAPTTASLIGTEKMRISGSGQIIISSSVSVSGSVTVTTGSIIGNHITNQLVYTIVNSNPAVNQNDFSPTGWNDADPAKATTIDISGSTSIKITGLAGGVHGRIAVLRNSSPDRLIILEDNATSSLNQNRFDFRNPVFLIPNGTIQLQYDSSSSRWEPIGSSGGIGFQGFFDQYEEFLGYNVVSSSSTNSAGLWTGVASGAFSSIGTSSYLQNTTERPLGIYDLNVGSTAAGRAHIGTRTSASIQPGYGQGIMLTRLALQQPATATENFQVFAGWHDSITGGFTTRGFPTKGIYWMYNSGSGAAGSNWQAIGASGSLSSSATVGPTVDSNYVWLGIYVNSQWNRGTWFYSTDTVTWFIAQDSGPGGNSITGSQIGFGVTAVKAIGTTGRLITVDALAHRYDINRN
jgi:hypothetical protein